MLDSFWRFFHSGHSGAVVFGLKVISRSLKVISRSFWVIFWHFHWVFSTYAHLFFSPPKCFFSPATGRDSLVKHIFWRRRKCERSEHFLAGANVTFFIVTVVLVVALICCNSNSSHRPNDLEMTFNDLEMTLDDLEMTLRPPTTVLLARTSKMLQKLSNIRVRSSYSTCFIEEKPWFSLFFGEVAH